MPCDDDTRGFGEENGKSALPRRTFLGTTAAWGLTGGVGAVQAKADSDSEVDFENRAFERREPVVAAGDFERIYDPSVQGDEPLKLGPDGPWYFNDHTFVRGRAHADDEEDTWHLYGITHPEPADPLDEKNFGHATAETLLQKPWNEQPFAMTATGENTGPKEEGEHHIWAPHVIFHGGTYYMFYTGGVVDAPDPHQRYKIQLATSEDLFDWTRHPSNPLFEDGFDARDPMVTRIRDQWVMYYTATSTPAGGHHVVAYRTSDDLVNWSEREIAFRHPDTGTFAGPTESPTVVRHGKFWYLFVCCDGDYTCTKVYRSRDPFRFDFENNVGEIDAHAAEVVKADGNWYISSAGWGQGGVYLAPLNFDAEKVVKGRVVTTPYYRTVVQTAPRAAITSMKVDPTGTGNYRRVLDSSYRSTGPYVAVGGFGTTDLPGAADEVTVTESGRRLTLKNVPFGDEPVTVDWSFAFDQETFDFSYDWHVNGATTASVWEVAWTFDTALPLIGDSEGFDREDGDVRGFPEWTLASDDSLSVVAAYRSESAWSEDNRFYESDGDSSGSSVVWQPLWEWGGREWPRGDYEGGTWRIGASDSPRDEGFARRLHEDLNRG